MKEALGLVEVRGLASAIHVADVMVKAANVHIIGLEKAKGSGWMTVKVNGDVGAVQAAVAAGAAEGLALQALISKLVIPRPAEGLDILLNPEPVITANKKRLSQEAQKAEPDAVTSEDVQTEESKEESKEEAKLAIEQSIAESVPELVPEVATVDNGPTDAIAETAAKKTARSARKRVKSMKVAKTDK